MKFRDPVGAAATSLHKCVGFSSYDAYDITLQKVVETILWLKGVIPELGVGQKVHRILHYNIYNIEWATGRAPRRSAIRKI